MEKILSSPIPPTVPTCHPLFSTMHHPGPFFLCLCALSLIARALENDDVPLTTTNLFLSDDGYSTFDELSNLPSLDSSYLLPSDPSSKFLNDASSSDFIIPPPNPNSSSSSCLFLPPSPPPGRTRTRRGEAENICPNPDEGGEGSLSTIGSPLGKTAPAPADAVTLRKTMEEVQQYWCAETTSATFSNIPVCDAIFDSHDLFQTPVDHDLEGSVPDQGFFNIQRGWPRECSLPLFSVIFQNFCDARRGVLLSG